MEIITVTRPIRRSRTGSGGSEVKPQSWQPEGKPKRDGTGGELAVGDKPDSHGLPSTTNDTMLPRIYDLDSAYIILHTLVAYIVRLATPSRSNFKSSIVGALGLDMPLRCFLHPRCIFHIQTRMPSDMTRIKCPAIRPKRTWKSNATNECTSATSGAPSPTRSTLDRKVVHVEPDVGKEDTNRRPEQDIKPVMPVVEPARRGNKACCRGREE